MREYFKIVLKITTLLFITLIVTCAYGKNNINVALKSDFPPYSFVNENNKLNGLAKDVLDKTLSTHYNLNYILSDGKKDSIQADIYGLTCQEQLPENYTFIPIPHQLEYFVFMRKNSGIKSLANLYNKRIIVVKNDLPFDVLYKNKTAHIFNVISYERPLKLLQSGINDCAIIPLQTGLYYINKQQIENIKFISTPYLTYQSGFAVKSSNWELISQLKLAINELIIHNQYNSIEEKWTNSFEKQGISNQQTNGLIIIIIVLVLIILILTLFNKMLRKEIEDTTIDQIKAFNRKKLHPLLFPVNESLFQSILDEMPIWLFINDKQGNIKHASKDFLREGLNIAELTNDFNINKCCNKDTLQLFNRWDDQIFSLKKQIIINNQIVNINEQDHNLWIIKYPIQLIAEGPIYMLNILIQPFIDGKSSLNKVASDLLFKTVINALPDIIYFKNIKGEYLGGNKALLQFLGKPERDIIGKTDLDLYQEEKAQESIKTDQMVFKAGITWEGNYSDKLPNGENAIFESLKIPLRDADQQIFGLVGINHDITRHHKYELQLAKAKELAEESNRIKSSFLANMSHEIRTPMNSIIGFTDLLADPDLTYDQRIELIDIIQLNGHNLIDLIDDIIDISKIESGQIHLKYTDFNINSVLRDGYTYGINKKTHLYKDELSISYQIGSIEDEFFINSDPFRLRQIFKNLFNASIRYTTGESLSFGYHINNNFFIFYLTSDSIGITEEFAKSLMETKEVGKYGFSEVEESSGISLIIAKNIIEMLGGNIWSDGMDTGSPNFFFTLPLKRAKQENNINHRGMIETTPDWNGKTILVAEDEETNFILLEGILEKTKANIIRACNGKEAIELYELNQDKINLVLMDIRMPEINGVEASRTILKINEKAIILAQTAYAMPEDKEMYLTIGMKGVIPKPIDPVDMYFLCNKYLKQ